MATSEELYKSNPGTGIDYGKGDFSKYLPFSNQSQAWWVPGKSEWLFGGGATKDMSTQPQTADYQRGYLQNFANRAPVTADATQSDQSRGQQQQLANMLFAQSRGQTPGAGEMAVNRQAGQSLAAQTSLASQARGANAGMAMRNAARNQADIGTNAAGQASIAQMQDQTNAQNQLGGLLGTQRGQDIGMAQGNQNAAVQQQQMQLAALAQMLGVDKAALEQDLEKRKLQTQDTGFGGSLLSGLGGIMAKSDERAKTDIVDASDEIDVMLLHLDPKRYRYKDEADGEGSRVGVMAQDLARSEAGRDAVVTHNGQLHIDLAKALSLALAAVARLDARVRELEGR